MADILKRFQVSLMGPSGLVYVDDKPQEFIETSRNINEVEREIDSRNMSVDPIKGTTSGRFLGCWMSISELPDEE